MSILALLVSKNDFPFKAVSIEASWYLSCTKPAAAYIAAVADVGVHPKLFVSNF